MYRTGIQVPIGFQAGGGLKFEHFGSIVISSCSVVGKHCTIFQDVTIGYAGRPGKGGVPVIGDNCVLCAGAQIIGPIKIGNNVMIGANAIVCKDISDNSVVASPMGEIISLKGTKGYFGN